MNEDARVIQTLYFNEIKDESAGRPVSIIAVLKLGTLILLWRSTTREAPRVFKSQGRLLMDAFGFDIGAGG